MAHNFRRTIGNRNLAEMSSQPLDVLAFKLEMVLRISCSVTYLRKNELLTLLRFSTCGGTNAGGSDFSFALYTSSALKPDALVNLKNADTLLHLKEYNTSRPTVFYFFGYIEDLSSDSVKTVIDAYLKRGDHNIVVVDWSGTTKIRPYPLSILKLSASADEVSEALITLLDSGLQRNLTHLVGHSMGAQCAGLVGDRLSKTHKLPRITALDPAYPLLYILENTHIKKTSADFVDVIHTDGGKYGAPKNTGSVDFYPNGGERIQPGCPKQSQGLLTPSDLCSHWRSWEFYAESLLKGESFLAVPCNSWDDFQKKRCPTQSGLAVMGFKADPKLRGSYYLTTNSVSPFGRGASGAVPL
ncbi:inactive pancreatic lipase-related protein 1-like isoform X1 [Schistocerca gregaria]|uniref:inactive pancreatic lipase-related protein 1-like isoform X1 n=1 Tax=Schistocerca gregaria TaxID=7010 RepID=UPI00211DECDB|nr:inactive pancreatic lipase-related protein 1-like isoform X1 [Schistocerca gregaria]